MDSKFFVTANRVVDAEVVGDVEYVPVGGTPNDDWFDGEPCQESKFVLRFKGPSIRKIRINGAEADQAWENFKNVVGADRLIRKVEEPEPAQKNDATATPEDLVMGCVKADLDRGMKHFDESGNLLETPDAILETLRREKQVTVQAVYGPRTVNYAPW